MDMLMNCGAHQKFKYEMGGDEWRVTVLDRSVIQALIVYTRRVLVFLSN